MPTSAIPQSATRQSRVLIGFSIVLLTLAAFKVWPPANSIAALLILFAAMALPMLAAEFMALPPRRSTPSVDAANGRFVRVTIKIIGLLATFGLVAAAYWAFPVYRDGQASVLLSLLSVVAVPMIVALPFYVWATDRVMDEPHDGCYMAGLVILGRWPEIDRAALGQYALGWVVKAFFAPIMFEFANADMQWFLDTHFAAEISNGSFGWYELAYRSMYFVEVFWGGVGYMLTLRLFGAQIRSTDATALGWIVCLVCYPPFWQAVSANYLAYDSGFYWGDWLADDPIVKLVWAVPILVATAIYAWATLSFGIRFSNLTHRGIITNGPYRWSKHPAYLAKNLSWWLISIPFVVSTSAADALRLSLLLAIVNVIYFLRAKTEERHLAQDPVYRAYADWIAEHGAFARLRRIGRGLRGRPAG